MKYQHLFFDLDHTLWDFEANSKEAMVELYEAYNWQAISGFEVGSFLETYYQVNDRMWALYRENRITKKELRHQRFVVSFAKLNITDEARILSFEQDYIDLAPRKTQLFPGCMAMLEKLKDAFQLHIITNGFAETQHIKLQESKLAPFFEEVITSDEVGVNKPAAGIFVEAMNRAKAERKNSLMIGDNLVVDVLGARKVGMDQIYFNPKRQVHQERLTFEVHHLKEIPPVLGL